MERIRHDGVLVVGAGLAGLTAALSAAPAKVLVLTEAPLNHGCSSAWAQGGVNPVEGGEHDVADVVRRHARRDHRQGRRRDLRKARRVVHAQIISTSTWWRALTRS